MRVKAPQRLPHIVIKPRLIDDTLKASISRLWQRSLTGPVAHVAKVTRNLANYNHAAAIAGSAVGAQPVAAHADTKFV
ncbi:MAG: hypothetical protein EB072_12645 [Betaproteobacteria bacterium]|nr:hypothetical protein [Betaproteobacteria bacterium]